MTMFSLGTIKIQTCIYGGLTIIREDEDLHSKMRSIQESYTPYTPAMLRKRAMTLMGLYYLINTGRVTKLFYMQPSYQAKKEKSSMLVFQEASSLVKVSSIDLDLILVLLFFLSFITDLSTLITKTMMKVCANIMYFISYKCF
jgi:hypothetical protein